MPLDFKERADISETELEHLKDKIPKWIKVTNKQKCIESQVVLITDGREVIAGYLDELENWRMLSQDYCNDFDFKVTHWMQFPEVPK